MNKHLSKLKNIKDLHIEMGYQCNLRCKMCFQKDYSQKMDSKIWQEKLLPIYPTLEKIIIQGGEPTVIQDTKKIIDLALKINPSIKFGTMTNGLLFDQYWQNLFVDHGFMVNFSLNAVDKTTYESIQRHSNYEKVWGNLKNLIALKNEKKSSLKIFISFVILPDNIQQLTDFVKMGQQLGVDRVRFFFDASMLPDKTDLVTKEVKKTIKLIEDKQIDLAIEGLACFYDYYCSNKNITNNYKDKIKEDVKKCTAPWTSLYIDHQAKVQFCCMSNLILGDLKKQTLENIWNNSKALKFRKRITGNDFRYCQPTCMENLNPDYSLSLTKIICYLNKFKFDFMASPKVAWQKTLRKIKQFIK